MKTKKDSSDHQREPPDNPSTEKSYTILIKLTHKWQKDGTTTQLKPPPSRLKNRGAYLAKHAKKRL